MGKDVFSLEVVKSGALIKFKNETYGFLRGKKIEKVDPQTIKIDGYEVSSIYIKYLNDAYLHRKEGMERWAEAARLGLGQAVRKNRHEADMYQKDFSVSNWTISEIERGKKMPTYKTIKSIANDLDMSFPEILSEASLEMWGELEDE